MTKRVLSQLFTRLLELWMRSMLACWGAGPAALLAPYNNCSVLRLAFPPRHVVNWSLLVSLSARRLLP